MRNQRTIVLVEDNDDHAEIFMGLLELKGIANPVVRLTDGHEAMEYLQANWMHREGEFLLLLDLKIPGLSGVDVLKKLRNIKGLSHSKVIVMSSADQGKDKEEVLSMGVDEMISKTGDIYGFVDRLASLLQEEDENDRP